MHHSLWLAEMPANVQLESGAFELCSTSCANWAELHVTVSLLCNLKTLFLQALSPEKQSGANLSCRPAASDCELEPSDIWLLDKSCIIIKGEGVAQIVLVLLYCSSNLFLSCLKLSASPTAFGPAFVCLVFC